MDPTVASQAVQANTINWNTIILAIISLMGTVLTGVMAIYMAKISGRTQQALTNTEDTKTSAAATAVSVEKVHVAVNSERAAMVEKMDNLQKVVLELSKDKAKLEEHARELGDRKGGQSM